MKMDTVSLTRIKARRIKTGSSALVLVLCFVVLMTVVVLAMLSHSVSHGLISNASANVTKSDLYGHGAIDQIIGDLEQEIVSGSSATSTTGGNIYQPTYATNSVPYNSGPSSYGNPNSASSVWSNPTESGATAGLLNLIKESAYGVAFESSGTVPQRAAPVSTTSESTRWGPSSKDGTSRNGRYVSVARWNKPLLLPKLSATFGGGTGGAALTISDSSTNTAPVASFVAPDWILTTADGITNPTSLDTSSSTTTSNILPKSPKYVIGRYAYTIYNEGGLLDANIAGSPAPTGGTAFQSPAAAAASPWTQTTVLSRKGPAAFADLTQLPALTTPSGTSKLTSKTPQQVVDQLVSWRNYATTQPTGSYPSYTFGNINNYFTYLLGLSTRFMTAGSSGAQSDHIFTSRQQLITFLQDIVSGNIADQAYLQDAMMYLGTFSRTLNQPSYWPDSTRPTVLNAASVALLGYAGGNTAFGGDNTYNPSFKSIRVTQQFVRPSGAQNDPTVNPDGTTAVVGEPLVKKRFPLSRLCWLTYKGPSATLYANTPGDPVIVQYLNDGLPLQLLKEGTTANIEAYFGLAWTQGPGGPNSLGGYWTYNKQYLGNIATLNLFARAALASREPNFFELLKAALCVGSLGKSGDCNGLDDQQVKVDQKVDFQVLEIGANMIDEYDPDSYPTQIVFTDNTGVINSFWGKEDLPYLAGQTFRSILKTPSNPVSTGADLTTAVTIANPGQGVALDVPIVWAPYVSNAYAAGATVPPPLNLRIAISGVTSGGTVGTVQIRPQSFSTNNVQSTLVYQSSWNLGTYDSSNTGMIKNIATPNGAGGDTALYFNNNSSGAGTLYRDPTPLLQPGIPAGSNLHINGTNSLALAESTSGVLETGTGNHYLGFLVYDNYPILWNQASPASVIPATTYTYTSYKWASGNTTGNLTISLEYQDTATLNWIPYMQFNTMHWGATPFPIPYASGGSDVSTGSDLTYDTGGSSQEAIVIDPRTARFSGASDSQIGAWLDSPTSTMVASFRPTGTAVAMSHGDIGTTVGWYDGTGGTGNAFGNIAQNVITSSPYFYYTEPDGVVRRGMAGAISAYSPAAATTVGLPTTTVYQNAQNLLNRPLMLNRPFRSVAELGCVFKDTPWKNLDFFQPESGESALLDVFCINEDYRSDAVSAGRVDLNTKQAPVIQSLLAGAYRDEITAYNAAPPTQLASLAAKEAVKASQTLVKRTTVGGTNPLVSLATPQPLINIADLVGRWVPGSSTSPPINGSSAYDGFSADLNSNVYDDNSAATGLPGASYSIQRFNETAMRALSDAGQAGTWNLLIDVIAQSGHYPSANISATNPLGDFLVEGERRYWVHVAIDRSTGQIIDEQIEPVNE